MMGGSENILHLDKFGNRYINSIPYWEEKEMKQLIEFSNQTDSIFQQIQTQQTKDRQGIEKNKKRIQNLDSLVQEAQKQHEENFQLLNQIMQESDKKWEEGLGHLKELLEQANYIRQQSQDKLEEYEAKFEEEKKYFEYEKTKESETIERYQKTIEQSEKNISVLEKELRHRLIMKKINKFTKHLKITAIINFSMVIIFNSVIFLKKACAPIIIYTFKSICIKRLKNNQSEI